MQIRVVRMGNGWHRAAATALVLWSVLLSAMVCQILFSDIAIAQNAIKRPLVFIPGMFGSKLCVNGDPSQLVWGSAQALTRFTKLKLGPDGATGEFKIEPCGEIDQFVYFGPLGQDVYAPLIEGLSRMGYRRDETLFVFDYDWRLSSIANAGRLAKELEKFAARASVHFTGFDGTFDILAHSLGGIIATLFVNTGDKRAARLIAVSSPFQGSVKFLTSLETGWGWVQRRLVSMQDVRKTALSFPSIYEVMPVYQPCCALGKPGDRVVLDLLMIDDMKKIKWFRDVPEDELVRKLDNAKQVRAALTAEPRIRATRMFGVQQETPEHIYLSRDPNANPDRLITGITSSWLGDGTVMDYSAMIADDLWRLPGATSHDRMMSDSRILEQIQGALLNNRRPRDKIAGEPLATCETTDGRKVVLDGATLEGPERVFGPNEDASVALSVRSSQVSSDPAQIKMLKLQANVVTSSETRTIAFAPTSEPEPDNEPTPTGGTNPFYKATLAAKFQTPGTVGDARIEVRCGLANAFSVWDFTVAQ